MNLNLQIIGERRGAVAGVVVGCSPAARGVGATAAASVIVGTRLGAARKQFFIYI